MNILNALGVVIGTGYSSGLNLYATVLTLGLLQRFDIIHLSPSLQIVSHPWVLGIAAALYLIEFFADKVPYIDTVWDAVHTLFARRPPRFWPTQLSARSRRNGVGPPPCSPEESR